MTMMDNLIKLFRVDSQVRGLRSRLEQAERYLAVQQRRLDEVIDEKHELETRRKQHQAKSVNLDTEVGSLNARIDKLRDEMNQAQTNKEYTALLTEINTHKAEVNELETQALLDLEQVEALAEEITSLTDQVADRTKHRDLGKQELEQRRTDVGERLAELEQERTQAATEVPATALAVFNELGESYDGEAMAAIEMIDKRNREYACGACNMHVPFETVSRLMSMSEAMVRCTVCRRILYIQDATRGALVGKK